MRLGIHLPQYREPVSGAVLAAAARAAEEAGADDLWVSDHLILPPGQPPPADGLPRPAHRAHLGRRRHRPGRARHQRPGRALPPPGGAGQVAREPRRPQRRARHRGAGVRLDGVRVPRPGRPLRRARPTHRRRDRRHARPLEGRARLRVGGRAHRGRRAGARPGPPRRAAGLDRGQLGRRPAPGGAPRGRLAHHDPRPGAPGGADRRARGGPGGRRPHAGRCRGLGARLRRPGRDGDTRAAAARARASIMCWWRCRASTRPPSPPRSRRCEGPSTRRRRSSRGRRRCPSGRSPRTRSPRRRRSPATPRSPSARGPRRRSAG